MLFTISPVVPHLDIVIVKCHGLLPNIDISSGSECERLCGDMSCMLCQQSCRAVQREQHTGWSPQNQKLRLPGSQRTLKKNIPATLDPHQYVSRTNRSTEDVISNTLHSVFTHPGESVQIHQDAVGWFHLSIQHNLTHVADWKTSHSGSRTSSTLVLDTGVPQGCVPGPLLFTPYTYNCTPRHQCNSSVKYVNHTTISGCKYIGRNLVILQSGVQRTIYCSMWAKPSMDKWSQAYPCTSLCNAILLHAKPRDCRYGKKKGRNYDS